MAINKIPVTKLQEIREKIAAREEFSWRDPYHMSGRKRRDGYIVQCRPQIGSLVTLYVWCEVSQRWYKKGSASPIGGFLQSLAPEDTVPLDHEQMHAWIVGGYKNLVKLRLKGHAQIIGS